MTASPGTANAMPDKEYRPGDPVPQTGVYRVVHDGHRSEHEATLLNGGQFPPCTRCGEKVRFALVRAAAPIHGDSDFEAGK
jgi:hypothetical protein